MEYRIAVALPSEGETRSSGSSVIPFGVSGSVSGAESESISFSVGLMRATLQEAVIYDPETQPSVLVTVHSEDGFITDEHFYQVEDEQIEDSEMVVETLAGSIRFDLKALMTEDDTELPASPEPTEQTAGTPTAAPAKTEKPVQNPTATPKSQTPSTPTPAPTPWTYCLLCNLPFYSFDEYAAHYNAVHRNAERTPKPTATPTAKPSGHWETVWVVDVPRVAHTVWVCNVCGKEFLSDAECDADQKYHVGLSMICDKVRERR